MISNIQHIQTYPNHILGMDGYGWFWVNTNPNKGQVNGACPSEVGLQDTQAIEILPHRRSSPCSAWEDVEGPWPCIAVTVVRCADRESHGAASLRKTTSSCSLRNQAADLLPWAQDGPNKFMTLWEYDLIANRQQFTIWIFEVLPIVDDLPSNIHRSSEVVFLLNRDHMGMVYGYPRNIISDYCWSWSSIINAWLSSPWPAY